jgi:tRNA threonylcarbamoyladenosine biosynthesis protein TsaE
MLLLKAQDLGDTHSIAAAIAELARTGDVIVLAGEMGAGKTAFAQGFGQALGVTEPITSPTFTLVHSYECSGFTLHHADLYRLERTSEVADLALGELAEFRGIVLVEWGDVAAATLGDHLEVRLETDPDALETRIIEVTAVGPGWAGRWKRLSETLEPYRC